jgi:hypothetical protein
MRHRWWTGAKPVKPFAQIPYRRDKSLPWDVACQTCPPPAEPAARRPGSVQMTHAYLLGQSAGSLRATSVLPKMPSPSLRPNRTGSAKCFQARVDGKARSAGSSNGLSTSMTRTHCQRSRVLPRTPWPTLGGPGHVQWLMARMEYRGTAPATARLVPAAHRARRTAPPAGAGSARSGRPGRRLRSPV